MQPETGSGIKTWQWAVTVIVVIVLIVIGVMVFGNKGAQAPAVAPTDTSNSNPTNNAQKDNAGVPGDVIGETYLNSGINPGKVTLTQPMVDGGTYYATLYSDNGDQKFDPATDLPMKDGNGNIIMHVFHGAASAGANLKG
jgi:hypothetical protein